MFPFVTKSSDKEIDKIEVSRIANMLGLHPKVIELLFLKGITSENDIRDFLYPSKANFHDPYLMKNMREIVNRLNVAIENAEKIVIYGDYDCDGICASSILSLYLSQLGCSVYCHIPNRECDGYGLNIESLEKIIENAAPDLIITCDCGISCINEVAFVLDLGVDIIVTDHHEAGEYIPDCLVLNPKQADCEYPFTQLCGAGVVLKLVEAHGGAEKASQFMGLAAIATVADLVPLTCENRLIVRLGLEYGHLIKNLGLKMLLAKLAISNKVLASDIAYKVAPRINAAGRMGDAYRSFKLLTSESPSEIAAIIDEIEHDNGQRKDLCNKLYDEALELLLKEDIVSSRAIILSHPRWEKGITGIVAARLGSEFYRPTFILVRSGNFYKGTARSVEGINIYELLTSVKDILIEFGGHSQAAGFSITPDNIPNFKKRAAEYLNNFHYSYFVAKIKYDLDIEINDITETLMRDMDLLEPFGNSNCRPLYCLKVNELKISVLNNADHLCINLNDNINIFAFGYARQATMLTNPLQKELILDFRLNDYKGKSKIDAYVKSCVPQKLWVDDAVATANFVKYINYKEKDYPQFLFYNEEELDSLVDENIFGTLIIAGSKESYEKLLTSKKIQYIIVHETTFSTTKNNYNRVMIAPEFDENLLLACYDKVIFLDTPIGGGVISFLNKKTQAKIYVPKQKNNNVILHGVDMSRETFARYYNHIKENEAVVAADLSAYIKISSQGLSNFDLKQFIICLSVFVELDLVKIHKKNFSIKTQKNTKANLENSKNYVYLKEIIDEIEA